MEDNNASVLLIFQSPGEAEWASGRPIASTNHHSAGARMLKAFQRVGKRRENYNITNAVQCFPGKKPNLTGKRPRDKELPSEAIQHCRQWLKNDIERQKYERIVVFGTPARDAVLRIMREGDKRFRFVIHATGGLSNDDLDSAIG